MLGLANVNKTVEEVRQHLENGQALAKFEEMVQAQGGDLEDLYCPVNPNHSYLSQLDVTYKTPDLMSHFLPPHEVSFTFCCSSIVFPR
ncbi:putative glutamine transport system permease protein [Streptococcus pneumoniae]|nr:putative glutamine transport system permease protein [Streptococcus pneumoniae]